MRVGADCSPVSQGELDRDVFFIKYLGSTTGVLKSLEGSFLLLLEYNFICFKMENITLAIHSDYVNI